MNTYNMGYEEAILHRDMQEALASAIAEAKRGSYISVRGFDNSGYTHIYGIYTMSEEEYCNYMSSGGGWSYLTYKEFMEK